MLRLLRLPVEIMRMLDAAEAASMQRIREGFDREIAEHAELQKKNQQRIAENQVHEAANAAALEVYLSGLVSRAATGDDVVVSVPTSLPVAVVGGPSIDALLSIVSAAGSADDEARRSQDQYLPHPADIASMIADHPEWSHRFQQIAVRMMDADRDACSSLTRMQAKGGLAMFQALKEERTLFQALLEAIGPDRFVRLVTSSGSLAKHEIQTPPPALGRQRDRAVFAAMEHVRAR